MRYLLVDRITNWEADRSMEGLKNVTMSEDFLEFHFPRFPVMPGSLILEALVQLAGWLEGASSDFGRWFLLERVKSVKYYGFALPGDQLALRVESGVGANGSRAFRGVATVEGERKAVADFEGVVAELGQYEDPDEQRNHFRILSRDITLS